MLYKQNSSLQEPVSHVTQSLPISFHHTVTSPSTDLILYLHWHSEIEFLYIEHGEAIFCIEEKEFHLKEGDAILVPPNLLHSAVSVNDSECEFYAIVFSPSFLLDACTNSHYTQYILPMLHYNLRCSLHLTPTIAWQNNILYNLRSMYQLSLGNQDQWELQMHGMLLIIWQWLYNNHLSKIETTGNITRLTDQLDEAINFIHNSYDSEITLSHLANLSHLSEGQFCRLFKQLTGFTPFHYLNRYRILKSCEYLNHSLKKVSEIASLCGYNNISYYNREFIKIMKVTPSAYRRVI